jgi:hypothetical protein
VKVRVGWIVLLTTVLTVAGDSSWMTTGVRSGINGLGPDFTITHCKIGLGNLNVGGDVASEATILTHNGTGRQFVLSGRTCQTCTVTTKRCSSWSAGPS